MDWDEFDNKYANSARMIGELSKKKDKEKELFEKRQAIIHEEKMQLQKDKERKDDIKHEEKMQLEKTKEVNTWKRSFISWTLNAITLIISIVSLIFSLSK